MDQSKYSELFPTSKRSEALRVALDVRKFEIDLYWRRASYFWAFIAATFVGYNTVNDESMEFALNCFGLFLSLAWVLANRGSKQWQENWEHHVDHLEDDVIGPLYKTTLPRSRPKGVGPWIDYIAVGPSGYSVSKINQVVSIYVHVLWWLLFLHSTPKTAVCSWSFFEIAIALLTVFGLVGLIFGTRTFLGDQGHNLHLRKSYIE